MKNSEVEWDALDQGINPMVELLYKHGFKTFESCEGGEGHCFAEPSVHFFGNEIDAMRAYEICEMGGFKVLEVVRVFRKDPVYDNGIASIHQIGVEIGRTWVEPFNKIVFSI